MDSMATQTSSESEATSQQSRIPAPATGNIEDERGNKTCLTIYILIGIVVIALVVAIVLGVTLSTRSSQPRTNPSPIWAPTPAPTLFLQRNMLCLR
jgi:flagellar basal body-associated protein FliL